MVLLYSDGLIEATSPDGTEYGLDRLKNAALARDATAEKLIDGVKAFASGSGLSDDATALMMRRNA